jgi:flagellar biosynthesis protein FliQ
VKNAPTILAILSLPVGLVAYLVAGNVIAALPLDTALRETLAIFLPLLVAGLCMLPLLVPFFDRMAKRDLAAAPSRQAAADGAADDGTPAGPDGSSKAS